MVDRTTGTTSFNLDLNNLLLSVNRFGGELKKNLDLNNLKLSVIRFGGELKKISFKIIGYNRPII